MVPRLSGGVGRYLADRSVGAAIVTVGPIMVELLINADRAGGRIRVASAAQGQGAVLAVEMTAPDYPTPNRGD
jgi:hypothetical protein